MAQIAAVRSSDAVTTREPSGLKAAAYTLSLCPLRTTGTAGPSTCARFVRLYLRPQSLSADRPG